ncbi:MAG: HAD family phosphatase [Herbinix sp.]|nr:HAD family phosphatase [Herbinix sp.]
MKLKCVLFDFDGVIADSENGVYEYLKKAFLPYGVYLTEKDKLSYIGTSGIQCIQNTIDSNHLELTVEKLMEEKMKLGNYYEDSEDLAPMPGAVELLQLLKKSGIRTGLVSSTRSSFILAALNRMNMISYFDVIICGDMIKERKPSPEGYLKAASLLKVKSEECIVIEDSPTGIRAAKAAGIFVIGYKGSEVLQNTSEADIEIHKFSECLDIEKLNSMLK